MSNESWFVDSLEYLYFYEWSDAGLVASASCVAEEMERSYWKQGKGEMNKGHE